MQYLLLHLSFLNGGKIEVIDFLCDPKRANKQKFWIRHIYLIGLPQMFQIFGQLGFPQVQTFPVHVPAAQKLTKLQ